MCCIINLMTSTTAISLLKLAVILLMSAAAPNTPQLLRNQAVQFANQAIILVGQSTRSSSDQYSTTAISVQPQASQSPHPLASELPSDQCPTAPAKPSASSCSGAWIAGYSDSSSGLSCLIAWRCDTTALGSLQSNQTTYSGPCPGQVFKQDYFCLTSIDPILTEDVPAGMPFPSGCYNEPRSEADCPAAQ